VFAVGEVISYFEMCREEDTSLQRGMNYHLRSGESLILMSLRKGAPYADRIGDDGKILIYEGHDVPNHQGGPDPKTVDQQIYRPGGGLTQNGLFHAAAKRHAEPDAAPEQVRVYEKLRAGIWVFTGVFSLLDAWDELSNGRRVFKFRLELDQQASPALADPREPEVEQSRLIPTSVKLEVWKRDEGKCVRCGSAENLHFDHVIPYSRGGSSLVAENIQLLCARHNLAKRDRIL
jgi:hypothetical protein